VTHYGLRKEDFLAVIDGMDMDVAEDIVGPSFAALDLYCDRVASAVGRLSIKVFGMEAGPGFELAHHLGRALQLTNILRDLDEDAEIGRLYLPREYLAGAGIAAHDPKAALSDPKIDAACRKVAALAREHYAQAARIMAAKPKGRIKTPKLMGAVYSEILRAMEKVGWESPRHRVSLGKGKLIRIVLANGLIG
jgi:phytoene synthase